MNRTDQDACAAEALLQLKFQSTSTNVQRKYAKEKCEPSCTGRICARPKKDSIRASDNRVNVLLDLPCEEKEKCRRFNERNIILKREINNLKNEVDSLTEIITTLQTQNLPAGINTDTSLINDQQEWQTLLKTTSRKAPPELPTGIETRNKFLALQTENREEKNSTITDDNSLFFIQMESVKMKRKLSYLENKVKKKNNKTDGVAKTIKNDMNKVPQTRKKL